MLSTWLLLAATASSYASPGSRPGPQLVQNAHSRCEAGLAGAFDRLPNDALEGLVTDAVELNIENMLLAYPRGIFPWELSGKKTAGWYNPPWRGILELEHITDLDDPFNPIPKSDIKILRRLLASNEISVTEDQAFEAVVRKCAEQQRFETDRRTGERVPSRNWIAPRFVEQFTLLHQMNRAHSLEAWRDGRLVGGLYGVFINGHYSGESMFFDPVHGKNATKLLFYKLLVRLKQSGHNFIDTQVVAGLAGKWGARYVPRPEYLRRLKAQQERELSY